MWQLTYINSIDTPPGVPQGAAPLMVVPVPNAHSMGELDFTLFAVNERQAGDLRRDTDSLSRDYTPPPPGGGGQSRMMAGFGGSFGGGGAQKLQVQSTCYQSTCYKPGRSRAPVQERLEQLQENVW